MKAKKVIAMLLAATLSVTAFTGCAINKTATVATLDKEDIKLGLVNFMIGTRRPVMMTCIYSTWARATGTRQYQAIILCLKHGRKMLSRRLMSFTH